VSDENDLDIIICNLDTISNNIFKFAKRFEIELIKIKKTINYHKKKKFIPSKFFTSFLKPLLKSNRKMTKKQILEECKKRRKYNSYNTLSSYLYKLEISGYLKSERLKREKFYILNDVEFV